MCSSAGSKSSMACAAHARQPYCGPSVPIGPILRATDYADWTVALHRCPFVLKPASRTPIGALIIGEVLSKAPHLPAGAFSVLPCSREGADLFTTDPRFKLLTFTGSPAVVRMPHAH